MSRKQSKKKGGGGASAFHLPAPIAIAAHRRRSCESQSNHSINRINWCCLPQPLLPLHNSNGHSSSCQLATVCLACSPCLACLLLPASGICNEPFKTSLRFSRALFPTPLPTSLPLLLPLLIRLMSSVVSLATCACRLLLLLYRTYLLSQMWSLTPLAFSSFPVPLLIPLSFSLCGGIIIFYRSDTPTQQSIARKRPRPAWTGQTHLHNVAYD